MHDDAVDLSMTEDEVPDRPCVPRCEQSRFGKLLRGCFGVGEVKPEHALALVVPAEASNVLRPRS